MSDDVKDIADGLRVLPGDSDIAEPGRDGDENLKLGMGIMDRLGGRGVGVTPSCGVYAPARDCERPSENAGEATRCIRDVGGSNASSSI